MLRSVDDWASENFALGEAQALAKAGPTSVAIETGDGGPSVTIPDAHLLFNAQFSRAGADLVLQGEGGDAYVVHDYFAGDVRAPLLSPEGAMLSADVVAALAGPVAPGQYAQAGAPAAAAQAVGRVAQASSDATIIRNGVTMPAQAGDPVLKGDVMQTAAGTLGVTFNDGSTLNLTANTRMVVNEFVYNPQGSQNSQLLNLVQGSLTFISGEIAHTGNMAISTPVATMGIRGTVGGVTTASDGTVNFYVSQSATGAVILDSRGVIIANVVQDGPMIIVRPVGPLQVIAEEVQKTPGQLAVELAALQQILSIKAIGDQILQQNQQADPNNNPNPQSTDKPLTQIQLFPELKKLGQDGNPTDNAADPNYTIVSAIITTPNPDGTPGTPTEVPLPPQGNVAPVLNFFNVNVAEGGSTVLSPADFQIHDPDSSSFVFNVANVSGGTFQLWQSGPAPNSTSGFSAFSIEGGYWMDVTSFTADDIAAGHVRFLHDGGNAPPAFSIWVGDYLSQGQAISPTVAFTAVNDAPEVQPDQATVSEEGLGGGLTDTAGDGDTTNSATATGTITATDEEGDQLTFSLGEPSAELTSGGEPITWEVNGNTLTGSACGNTIVTVVINEHSGAYTVTLSGPVDHPDDCAEDVVSIDVPVNVTDGVNTSTTTLTVKVEDDAPKAADYTKTSVVGAVTSVNFVIMIDVSGSMAGDRIALAKDALSNLLATTSVDVNQVMVVAFSGGASVHLAGGSPWTDPESADSFIQGLNVSGGTNYDAAVAAVMSNWGGGPSSADKTMVYFISDGEPSPGQGLDTDETQAWQNFLASKGVDVANAIGISTGLDDADLAPIAWAPENPDLLPIVLTSATGLDATLQGTVPNSQVFNVITDGAAGTGLGADGGRVLSVEVDGTTYTWDGDNTITHGDGESACSENGTSISVTTALGGTFTFYFAAGNGHAAGDWSYTPPGSPSGPTTNEIFHYVLVDNDGDQSGANITVTLSDGLRPAEATDDHLIISASNVYPGMGERYIKLPFDFLAYNDSPDGALFTTAYLEADQGFWPSEVGAGVSFDDESGLVFYRLQPEHTGTFDDTFDYAISNDMSGNATSFAKVWLDVVASTTLTGGANSEIIVGGTGDETLTGNGGADAFVFMPGNGHDTITDFKPGEDKIVLLNWTPGVNNGMSAEEAAFLLNPTESTLDAWKSIWTDIAGDSVTFTLHHDPYGDATDTVTVSNSALAGPGTMLDNLHVNDFIVQNMLPMV